MARVGLHLAACVCALLFASAAGQTSEYDQNIVKLANFLLNTTEYSDFGRMLQKNCTLRST